MQITEITLREMVADGTYWYRYWFNLYWTKKNSFRLTSNFAVGDRETAIAVLLSTFVIEDDSSSVNTEIIVR